MSEAEKKKTLWRKILLCPATWLALFWYPFLLLWWLFDHPDALLFFLPSEWHDGVEEFIVMQLDLYLFEIGLFFLLLSLALALVAPFFRRKSRLERTMMTLLYLFLAFLWLAVVSPGTGMARERTRRISCSSNLKQIYLSLEQYAEDNEGFLPPELALLNEQGYLTDREVYRCASRTRPNAEFSDYLYFGKDQKLKAPPFLLVRDRDGNHPGIYWNNLYSNGQVLPEPVKR